MTPTKVKNVNFCLFNNIIQYFLILFVISIIKFRGLTRRTLLLKKLNCGHFFITYIYTYIYVKYITSFIPQIIEFIKNILDKERAYLAMVAPISYIYTFWDNSAKLEFPMNEVLFTLMCPSVNTMKSFFLIFLN